MQRKQQVGECWVCVIFFACVCVGTSDSTTASDDPNFLLFVSCAPALPRGVPGGARYAPPWLRATFGAAPRNFFLGGFSILADFAIFSGFLN
jgi:hypothetical protein